MKHKSFRPLTNVGFSTILLGFSMICIVTFSVLALITANSDYQLSQKVATKTTAYYLAEKEAYTTIAMIDQQLQKIYFSTQTENEFCEQALSTLSALKSDNTLLHLETTDDNSFTCQISKTISDRQTLAISLLISYPQTDKMPFYTITQWQTITEEITEENKPLSLIGSK